MAIHSSSHDPKANGTAYSTVPTMEASGRHEERERGAEAWTERLPLECRVRYTSDRWGSCFDAQRVSRNVHRTYSSRYANFLVVNIQSVFGPFSPVLQLEILWFMLILSYTAEDRHVLGGSEQPGVKVTPPHAMIAP